MPTWTPRPARPTSAPTPATRPPTPSRSPSKGADRAPPPERRRPRGALASSVRIHDRTQHDPALVRPVVAGAAVHRRALVPHQDVADAPAVVVDEALLGRVSGELIDQRPRLLPLDADEAMRVHGIDEQD